MGVNAVTKRCAELGFRVLYRGLATHTGLPERDYSSITPPYARLQQKLAEVREILGRRPLTLAEKILYSHITDRRRVWLMESSNAETPICN